MQRIVIVGASSAIAEHCARYWIKVRPVDLTLVGRDALKLERISSDLKLRGPLSNIRTMTADFIDPGKIERTVKDIYTQGMVDIVLIAHGSLPDQSVCQTDLSLCKDFLEINGVSPVLFAEIFASIMEKANFGTIALIGSVAGDRGRKSNYVYGAAKNMVARYAQGLQHRLAKTEVKVVLIKPGPTDTPMTAHLKKRGTKLESVAVVARQIVRAIERKDEVAYVTGKWYLIMHLIMHLPRFIFNKMDI
jgi:decaprenylphospho-beta-D-erythro-pentofuranosid-2-ulose 2-reductase